MAHGHGGRRSGAGRPRERFTVEQFRSIDVRRFDREGLLRPGVWTWWWRDAESGETTASIRVLGGEQSIELHYQVGERVFSPRVIIDRTACGYGGSRAWFLCPVCFARRAILYAAGGTFACRACHGLVYASQSDSELVAAQRRVEKAAERLEGPHMVRPKGMHDATYSRIIDRVFELKRAAEATAIARTQALLAHVEQELGID